MLVLRNIFRGIFKKFYCDRNKFTTPINNICFSTLINAGEHLFIRDVVSLMSRDSGIARERERGGPYALDTVNFTKFSSTFLFTEFLVVTECGKIF